MYMHILAEMAITITSLDIQARGYYAPKIMVSKSAPKITFYVFKKIPIIMPLILAN